MPRAPVATQLIVLALPVQMFTLLHAAAHHVRVLMARIATVPYVEDCKIQRIYGDEICHALD